MGRQLLREALLTIIARGRPWRRTGDRHRPDTAGLAACYAANGFLRTAGPDLRMYKVATARAYLR